MSGNSETICEFPTHERRGPGKESGKSGKGCEECPIGEIFWVLLQLVMCQDITPGYRESPALIGIQKPILTVQYHSFIAVFIALGG